MQAITEMKMSGSEENSDIFSRVTRTFHVVVVQDNGNETY